MKRILSMLLALVMVVGLMPGFSLTASAAEADASELIGVYGLDTYRTSALDIVRDTTLNEDGTVSVTFRLKEDLNGTWPYIVLRFRYDTERMTLTKYSNGGTFPEAMQSSSLTYTPFSVDIFCNNTSYSAGEICTLTFSVQNTEDTSVFGESKPYWWVDLGGEDTNTGNPVTVYTPDSIDFYKVSLYEGTRTGIPDEKPADIVWVGGQGMTASTDGTVVSYYTNGAEGGNGIVTTEEPEAWHAKLSYTAGEDGADGVYTLELNDLNANGIKDAETSLGAGIYSTVPLTINLNGDNTVVGSTYGRHSYGIHAPGLTINGTDTATLIVNSADVYGHTNQSCGIYSEGNVVINTANIKATGGEETDTNPGYGVGIFVVGKLIINNSQIKAIGTDSYYESAGIYVVASANSRADMRYTGGGESSGSGGSTVVPDGEPGETTEEGGVTINGGEVTAIGDYAGFKSGSQEYGFSNGIFAYGAITINNANVTATSDYGSYGSYALESYYSDININGGKIVATGGASDNWYSQSIAVYAKNNFAMTAGEVIAVSGETPVNSNFGVCAFNDVTISGGSLTVNSADADVDSIALRCLNDLTISGDAQIIAKAAEADVHSYGTFVKGNFHMSGTASLTTSSDRVGGSGNVYNKIISRSAGIFMGNEHSGEDYDKESTFTITGGTLKAWWAVSDEEKSHNANQSFAVGLLDVIENKFIFSDDDQTNAQWYEWSITPDSDYNPTEKIQSTNAPYVYETSGNSAYLYIGPKGNDPIIHEVTFDSMGGSEVTPNPAEVEDGKKVARPDDPTKDDYTFVGWFTIEDGGETLSDTPYDFDTPVVKDITLYAKWTENKIYYTVTYDLNGGTAADGVDYDPVTVEAGTEITVKAAPEQDGYTFTGWSDGTTTYQPNDTITVTGNITLTAQWEDAKPPVIDPPEIDPPIIIPIGSTTLTKVDAEDTATVLPGVVFELYRSDGRLVGTYITDGNGEIYVSGLTAGTYYWREIRAAEGYVLDETEYTVTVQHMRNTAIVVENERAKVPEVFSGDHYAYIIGYDDGLVHPEANITRAEVATIFFRLLDDETRARYMTRSNSFSDVEEGMWFNTAVSTMASMGIVTGRPGGIFDPNANITRAEFAAIAARFDTNGNTSDASFTDIYGHWAMKEINIAANNGWVLGYEDGTFRPDQKITRAEAMTMVNRVLQRIPEYPHDLLDYMVTWPDNMDTSSWYYLMVQEATNSHDYHRKENGYEYWTGLREVPDWAALEK